MAVEWPERHQLDADATCAALTGVRKTLRGLSASNATPKPKDIEAVRGVRLSLAGATHFIGVAAINWGLAPSRVDALVQKSGGIVDALGAWLAEDKPRRVNLRKIFARYERLHDAIIAIGDGSQAPRPRGEGGDGGGGDGGGK